jgi:hypothetical protein
MFRHLSSTRLLRFNCDSEMFLMAADFYDEGIVKLVQRRDKCVNRHVYKFTLCVSFITEINTCQPWSYPKVQSLIYNIYIAILTVSMAPFDRCNWAVAILLYFE